MPNLVSCTVTGLAELENAMLEQTPKKARSAMREALEFAGEFMRVSIALAVKSSRSGYLARHIVKKITLSTRNDAGTVSIGPSRDAYYAAFVEFGSIHNRPPEPFMRPAFESNKERMLDAFARKLKEALGL
jgi:HK97 gp10 family phage protein